MSSSSSSRSSRNVSSSVRGPADHGEAEEAREGREEVQAVLALPVVILNMCVTIHMYIYINTYNYVLYKCCIDTI